MQNIIFHLDMNSYFASVHQQDHPETRHKPVGICEHLGGIIIAASVDAKRWGIKTGTPVWEARKLYPKIILAPTAPERYRYFTRRFLKVMGDYTDKVEPYSIDEAFMDAGKACNIKVPRSRTQDLNKYQISNIQYQTSDYIMVNPFEEAVRIALEIKRRMKIEVGDYLTCSIGIAENKLLAKIGSDLKKPDGIVVIIPLDFCHPGSLSASEGYPGSRIVHLPGSRLSTFAKATADRSAALGRDEKSKILIISKDDLYHRLKLIDIPGIGRRQEKNLKELGIKTLAELRDYPQSHLVARFGRIGGYHLYNMGQLKSTWKAPVHRETEMKSIGHMYTLPREYREQKFFLPVLYKLCEMVGRRMRKTGLMGDTIHFYAHDKNYEGFGKSLRLKYFIQDGREIFLEAAKICTECTIASATGQRTYQRPISGVKLIGITIAGLRPFVNQLSIFGDVERQRRVTLSLDKINNKYGDFTVCRVPILAAKDVFQDSVGFGE